MNLIGGPERGSGGARHLSRGYATARKENGFNQDQKNFAHLLANQV